MIELQHKLLADHGRNVAFYEALKQVIKPGMTVSDIGAGTGFLSFLALQFGASKAYAYEVDPALVALGKKLMKENHIKGCTFVEAYSTELLNPPKTDVVMSETLGNYALEEHILEIMADAKRYLKPGGILMPALLEQYVVPVASPRIWKLLNIWNDVGFGLSFEAARRGHLNNMFVYSIPPRELMHKAEPIRWDTITFGTDTKSRRSGSAQWRVQTNQMVWGFALWWKTTIYKEIVFSTSPFDNPTHWEQIFIPVLDPIALKAGDVVSLHLSSDTRYTVGVQLDWDVSVKSAQGVETSRQKMSNRLGC